MLDLHNSPVPQWCDGDPDLEYQCRKFMLHMNMQKGVIQNYRLLYSIYGMLWIDVISTPAWDKTDI